MWKHHHSGTGGAYRRWSGPRSHHLTRGRISFSKFWENNLNLVNVLHDHLPYSREVDSSPDDILQQSINCVRVSVSESWWTSVLLWKCDVVTVQFLQRSSSVHHGHMTTHSHVFKESTKQNKWHFGSCLSPSSWEGLFSVPGRSHCGQLIWIIYWDVCVFKAEINTI